MRTMTALLTLVCATTALGQDAATAASFLVIEPSTRATGMGGAGVSLVEDSAVLFRNPGALGCLDGHGLSFGYAMWFRGMNYLNISASTSFDPHGTIAGGVMILQYGEIDRTFDEGTELVPGDGGASASDVAAVAGYGVRVFGMLSFGFAAKIVTLELDEQRAFALAVDGGLLLRPRNADWAVGVAAQNFGTQLTFESESHLLPRTLVRGGGHYTIDLGDGDGVLVAADVSVPHRDLVFGNVGVEACFHKTAFIRGGYQFGGPVPGMKAGVGARYKGIVVDYAAEFLGDLGVVHRASARLSFGGKKEPRKDPLMPDASPRSKRPSRPGR